MDPNSACGKKPGEMTRNRSVNRVSRDSLPGSGENSGENRPTTMNLLSHGRKIIEKVLDKRLRQQYKFYDAQVGFRRGRSTETAVIRTLEAFQSGCRYVVVLDL